MSSWYDPALRRDDEFQHRRSSGRTVAWVVVALVGAAALLILVPSFADLQQAASESTDELSTRNAIQTRLAPGAGVIAAAAALGIGLFSAVARSRVWVRRETGHRLRRRFETGLVGGTPAAAALESRFRTGDPRGYAPMPEGSRAWDVAVDVWTVPEDSIAYVGITVGRHPSTASYRPLMRFRERPYDALLAALDNGLDRPLPDDRNPLAIAGIPFGDPGDAAPRRPGTSG